VDSNDIVALSKDVIVCLSNNKTNTLRSTSARPFPAPSREGRKKEGSEDERKKDIDRIPKHQKIPFVINRNRVEYSSQTFSVDSNDVVALSKDAMVSPCPNKTDNLRSTTTHSFPASIEGKRK
jgi:hypothetical protein